MTTFVCTGNTATVYYYWKSDNTRTTTLLSLSILCSNFRLTRYHIQTEFVNLGKIAIYELWSLLTNQGHLSFSLSLDYHITFCGIWYVLWEERVRGYVHASVYEKTLCVLSLKSFAVPCFQPIPNSEFSIQKSV